MSGARGLTLVELMVVLVIVVVGLVMSVGQFGPLIGNKKAQVVVAKFISDVRGARALAASGAHTVLFTLNSDCSWFTTVDGSSSGSLARPYSSPELPSGFGCAVTPPAGSPAQALPVQLVFTAQGYLVNSVNLSFSAAGGQRWVVTMVNSGTVLLSGGSS